MTTSLVWLQWGCPKVHAFVVTDGIRSERTLCNNYIGRGSEPEAVIADPVLGDRCAHCDGVLRSRGQATRVRDSDRLDVYRPFHKFEEWAQQP